MLEMNIPGFESVRLEHLVSDFTGTPSVDGKLLPGVKKRLNRIVEFMKVHILTADTFSTARKDLKYLQCKIHILTGKSHDVQKEDYVTKRGAENAVAFGNGNNDRKMLRAARIAIAVSEGEGCAVDAIIAANIPVRSAVDGLDLLFNPKRMKTTLRF